MKRRILLAACWIAALTATYAQVDVPNTLLRQYRTREERRTGFLYTWDVEEVMSIDERLARNLRIGTATTRKTHSEWLIWAGADITVVRGTRDQSVITPGPRVTKQEYFGKGWVMAGPDYHIWACDGDCVRYRHPTERSGLDVLPEDFVLLAGKDLFRLYGASWRVVAQGRDQITVRAEVSEGNFSPFAVTAVLMRSSNWEPADIRVDYQRSASRSVAWSRHYQVLSYRRWRDGWFPDVVVCDEDSGFDAKLHRVWRLKRIEPIRESFPLPPIGQDIADYRLLGSNLTDAQVSTDDPLAPIIYYRWQGHLPSVEQLRQLWQQQTKLAHRQGGAQAASARWWRLIPPLLLILIGVLWYWRLRMKKVV